MTREFTGWHMLGIMVVMFGTIIAVNLTLAYNAVKTFPGLETRNSYVVSQSFDADRAAQNALGWTLDTQLTHTQLSLAITDAQGAHVTPKIISATLGRATNVAQDMTPEFTIIDGVMRADVDAGAGYWNLRIVLEAEDGTQFRRRVQLTAK
ncbi:Nitrogen fixation protein FixH [Yoonia tamlensis]|uniref:Nitrogen fixation protein FixH n=1 Tax=Yoonia tamlensis TaxID=390270 RepID=A0A1I6FR52_9RHOB|nr:FixH family protein [Yoonia tamlensis]SFR32415.1 Nitrogen fixation protein FixH [Yoonia tamlensis]